MGISDDHDKIIEVSKSYKIGESIVKIFNLDDLSVNWNEFTLKTNEKFGSNISWAYKDGMQIITLVVYILFKLHLLDIQ